MTEENELISVKVRRRDHHRLEQKMLPRETFAQVINRLLDEAERKKRKRRVRKEG